MRRKFNGLKYAAKKIWCFFCRAYLQIKELVVFIKKCKRARRIRPFLNQTLSEKLIFMADKIEAIENYRETYCDYRKVGRVEAHKCMMNYKKLKNDVKKEIIVLLYNY